MIDDLDSPKARRERYFAGLFSEARDISAHELSERIKQDPNPSDDEIAIGAYYEQIEPQMRAALRIMNNKGYTTESSGFWGNSAQRVEGTFDIDEQTKEKLEAIGCEVKTTPLSYIQFPIEDGSDLRSVEEKWLQVADILPDLGHPGNYSSSVGSDEFRAKILDQVRVERVLLERQLASDSLVGVHKKLAQEKLAELKKL